MIAEGIRWGRNLLRDCQELRRLEAWGLYPPGHHELNCRLDHVVISGGAK